MGLISRDKLRLNYFNRFMFTLNIVVLLIAYSIYLNRIFKPSQIPYFNFISIGYLIVFVFVALFIGYWLLVSWRHFILITLFSIGTFHPIYLSYPLINISKPSKAEANLSVMSFNVHGFRADGTKELIEKNLTDIMFFQEGRKGIQKKWKEEKLKNYYSEYYDVLSIHSKYPIIETRKIEAVDSDNGSAAYADIDLGFDTIRVINIYMEPMYIDKSLVKDVINSDSTEEIELSSKKLENKLVKGMKIHEKQIESLRKFFEKSPHPILVASDLNSTPVSYEYEQLTNYFSDSFIQAGKGNGTTFHGFKFPIRIDYLFHTAQFEVVEAKVIRKKFSDHFPIIVHYKLHN